MAVEDLRAGDLLGQPGQRLRHWRGPAAVTISPSGWFAEPKWLVEGSPA